MDGIDIKWWHKTMLKTHDKQMILVDHLGNSHLNVETFPNRTFPHFAWGDEVHQESVGTWSSGHVWSQIFCRNKGLESDVSSIFQIRFQILADMGFDLIPQARFLNDIENNQKIKTGLFYFDIRDSYQRSSRISPQKGIHAQTWEASWMLCGTAGAIASKTLGHELRGFESEKLESNLRSYESTVW